MLSLLSVASRGLSDAELRDIAVRKANCSSGGGTGPLVGHNSILLSTAVHEPDDPDLDQTSTTTATGSLYNQNLSSSSGAPARPSTISGLSDQSAGPSQPGPSTSRVPFGSAVRLGRR
ncbi:unnamed protein product [Echinostoma caproni]|uniref:Uncharacterized protein n=1 Tax=Echinostoma caproni TaxID=27848 RepID=A0A183ANC7_9TREM|nr:unnamed protein product [Echinostoma caproni]